MAGLIPYFTALALACGGKPKPVETEPTEPGTTETEPQTTPNTVPTYACPPPPDNALTFSAGTVLAGLNYTILGPEREYFATRPDEHGWDLVASGLSYTHEKACVELTAMNEYRRDIEEGRAPGQFWFELALNVPGTRVEDWIGLHPQGSGDMNRLDEVNHDLTIGWRNAEHTYPHFVSNLPHGWTASEVCIGQVRPDYIYLTVLWDPVDGPYRTNDWMPMDQPIWFDMEIWRSDGGDPKDPEGSRHRSCMALAWNFVPEEEPDDPISRYYADYTWPGKPDFDERKPTLP